MEPGSSQICTEEGQEAAGVSYKRRNSNKVAIKGKNYYKCRQMLEQVAQRDCGISSPADNQILSNLT